MEKINTIAAFYVVTGSQRWGRHLELAEAFKAAGIKADEKKVQYVLTVFLFKIDTPESVMKNILACYNVDFFGNLKKVDELEEVDKEQIDTYLAGWSQYTNFKLVEATKAKIKSKK